MSTSKTHGIARKEWERRFGVALVERGGLDTNGADDGIVAAELESWPERDEQPLPGFDAEWLTELPEDAAAEALSNWTD
jgi:hypothetical protein